MVEFRPFGPDLSQDEVTFLANDNFNRVRDKLNQLDKAANNYAQTKGAIYSYTGAALPATIVSVTITTSGNPVQVVCSGDANPLSVGGWGAINLYRGTTAIGQKVQFESSAANENNPYSLSVIDTPPKGTHTYSLKITNNSGGTVNFGENEGPIIYAIELNGVRGPQGPVATELPYYNGDIGNETAATYKTLGPYRELYYNFTKTNSTTLTVNVKGIYVIQAQQLISATTAAGYFEIRINNNTATYGYYPGSSFNDVPIGYMALLNVGDTIRIYQTNAISSSWSQAHSNINIFCIQKV